jgi:hypothetical protein
MPASLKVESRDRRAVLSLVAVLAVALLVGLLPGTLSAYHGIGGTYDMAESEFAPLPGGDPLIGDMVVGSPLNGCSPFANAAAVSGNLVLVVADDECDAPTRYLNAVAAGAAGLVAYMDVAGPPVAMEDPEGDIEASTIPAVTIEQSSGDDITTALGNDHTVRVSLIADGDDGFYIHSRPTITGSLSATAVTQTSLTLQWPAAADPDDDVVGYRVLQGAAELGTVAQLSFPVSGLAPGTQYSFSVIAVDSVGLESLALEGQFQTQDLIPPNWPPGVPLSVSDVTQTSLTLNWPAAEDADSGNTIQHYLVSWTGSVSPTQVSGDQTSLNVSPLTAGTSYTFTVVAVDDDDLLSPSLEGTFSTTWIAPVWPDGAVLTVTPTGANDGATLSWPAASDP